MYSLMIPTAPQALFFGFASLLLLAAGMTVFSKQLVRAALCLVLSFFAAAALWILTTAEFLGLVLVLVYVGAVMTLFLFVLMTVDQKTAAGSRGKAVKWIYGLPSLAVIAWLGLMGYAIQKTEGIPHQKTKSPRCLSSTQAPSIDSVSAGNTQTLGKQLYTEYAYPFELAGVLLLVAIIAAIALSTGDKRPHKQISTRSQIDIQRADRIRLLKMDRGVQS